MKVEIKLRKDFLKLMNDLGRVKNKQLPYATAQALNQLALESRPIIQSRFEAKLDIKKKSLLRKAIQVDYANKNDFPFQSSIVGIVDSFEFLSDHAFGLTRKARNKFGKAIPMDIKRSSSGSVPKSQRPGALLKRKGIFTTTSENGREIIVKRDLKETRVLYIFAPSVRIKKTVWPEVGVQKFFASNFDRVLGEQLGKAIAKIK